MAGLIVPVSGPYTGTYNGSTIGILSDDGYKITGSWQSQEINETDAYGMTLIDWIHRGHNWRCVMRGQNWGTGLLTALQTFGKVAGQPFSPALTNIGNDALNGFTASMILTATLANPPTTPLSLTALQAAVSPNNSTELLFTSKLRELPVEMAFLPYSFTSGGVSYIVPFSVT